MTPQNNEDSTILFTAEPEAGAQNFPGEIITLKWQIPNSCTFKLYQSGIGNPLPVNCNQEKEKNISLGSVDVTFRLAGYDNDNNLACERTLSVKVLRPGWYDTKNTLFKGDPGYPDKTGGHYDLEPTSLLNADDVKLYGIFRFIFEGKEQVHLFETDDPFSGWRLFQPSGNEAFSKSFSDYNNVFSTSPGNEDKRVFPTSPGIYYNNKIWLIGGSQIHGTQRSRGVWCFNPQDGKWEDRGPANWEHRMGHAVLKFQNKICVLGGYGRKGKALNDVWTLDISKDGANKTWTCLQEDDASQELERWKGRCLFIPLAAGKEKEEKIWLYGGAPEPLSANVYNDAWFGTLKEAAGKENKSELIWEKANLAFLNTGDAARNPIASCLQLFQNRLHLFAKFKTLAADKSEKVETQAYVLVNPTTNTWEEFPCAGLRGWGEDKTFGCQVTAYNPVKTKRSMLIARALGNGTAHPVMKIYVPGIS